MRSLGPEADDLALTPEDHPIRKVPITEWCLNSELKMLGVPIGRSGEHGFHEALWKKKVTELEVACTELLGVPDPQIQHCLLRQCLDAAKLQFLLRCSSTECPAVQAQVLRADEAILGVAEGMVGTGLNAQARAQVALPFSEGGLGVRIPSDVRPSARAAGIASYVRSGRHTVGVPEVACGVVPEDFPSIIRDLQAVLGPAFDPLVQWAKDWSSVLSCSPTHASQAWWTAAWGSAKHRALLSSAEGRDAARLASQSGGLGTAWMQIVHMDSDTGRIPPTSTD